MKSVVWHERFGEIVYEESYWTGKKTITVNGTVLMKATKTKYYFPDDQQTIVEIKGSFITGVTLYIGTESIQVTEKPTKLETGLCIAIFVFNLVWGNNVALCSIIPLLGGALGGFLSAGMAGMALILMKNRSDVKQKLLIWAGVFVLSFVVCAVLGYALASLLYSL